MKRMIAAAAMAAMLVGLASPAWADNHTQAQTTTTQTATTEAPVLTTSAQGGAQAEATTQQAVDTQLPTVTIQPDSFLYAIKLLIEKVRVAITLDAATRAQVLTEQAETRLAEAKAMLAEGKADLAAAALAESQLRFQQAQVVLNAAAQSGKDLSALQKDLTANEAKISAALAQMVEAAPEAVRAEVEAAATDVLVQMVAARDHAAQDQELIDEATRLAAEANLQAYLESLPPRVVLVLNAMAKAAGADLAEVAAMYQAHPGLGVLAKQLGVKVGAVQRGAQADFMAAKAGGKIELEIKAADGSTMEIKIAGNKTKIEVKSEAEEADQTAAALALVEEEESEEEDESDEDSEAKLTVKGKEKKEKDEKKGRGRGVAHGKGRADKGPPIHILKGLGIKIGGQ